MLPTSAESSIGNSHSAGAGGRLCCLLAQGSDGAGGVALGNHVAGAAFAAATLHGHAQLKLDFIKTHARTRMAGNVTVRNTAADTNNHGSGALSGRWFTVKMIINENLSH